MCKYCEYNDNYEWLMSISMGKANPYLDLMTRTRINPTTNKLSLSVATESDGEDQIIVDMPINYCPVCGRSMNTEDLIESLGGADLVAKEIFNKISDMLVGSKGNTPVKHEKMPVEPAKTDAGKESERLGMALDWLDQKKRSTKIDMKNASADWDAFYDMAVADMPIPDLPRLRVGLYNVGVQKLGNDPTKLSQMSNQQIINTPGVGPVYQPWFIRLRDYAKEVC